MKPKDVPWVESHKLGEDIVFLAAGYVTMAMEAICQVTGTKRSDKPSLSLRNVNIIKAFLMSSDPDDAGIEVFTTLRPTKISGNTSSVS